MSEKLRTADMTTAFERSEFTIKDIARGFGSIKWRVKGFWSTPVEVYVNRDASFIDDNLKGKWSFEISNSSGGHEGGISEVERARNFSLAINDACDTVEFLKTVEDQLEIAFQEHVEEFAKKHSA